MDAVVEIDEIGEIVDACPVNRLIVFKTFTHQPEILAVGEELRVAVHACLDRRNSSKGGILDRRVTIAAIDAIVACVMLVAELQRLLAWDKSARVVRRNL